MGGSLVSSVLGTLLPGTGTLYRAQDRSASLGRARLGDRLNVTVRCIAKRERPRASFDTQVTRADGSLILEGIAEVEAPTVQVVLERKALPLLLLDEHDHFGSAGRALQAAAADAHRGGVPGRQQLARRRAAGPSARA